ncbi:MAG: hypothetical protein ACM30H_03280 [Clostridia bacterium]
MAEVKRLDAGGDILISGETREEVDAALKDLVSRGADVVTPLSLVGRTWVAACSQPTNASELDRTSTLDLRDIQAAMRERRPEAALCQVEEAGLKRIVTGPTFDAVHARLSELIEQGATLVSEPEESFGSWIAVCDTGQQIDKDTP